MYYDTRSRPTTSNGGGGGGGETRRPSTSGGVGLGGFSLGGETSASQSSASAQWQRRYHHHSHHRSPPAGPSRAREREEGWGAATAREMEHPSPSRGLLRRLGRKVEEAEEAGVGRTDDASPSSSLSRGVSGRAIGGGGVPPYVGVQYMVGIEARPFSPLT